MGVSAGWRIVIADSYSAGKNCGKVNAKYKEKIADRKTVSGRKQYRVSNTPLFTPFIQ